MEYQKDDPETGQQDFSDAEADLQEECDAANENPQLLDEQEIASIQASLPSSSLRLHTADIALRLIERSRGTSSVDLSALANDDAFKEPQS